jgi:hypothetical protein
MTEQGVRGAEIEVTALCPTGTLAVGGGFKIHNGKNEAGTYEAPPNDIAIDVTRPYFDPNDDQTPLGWKVAGRVTHGTGTKWNLEARVICAELGIVS